MSPSSANRTPFLLEFRSLYQAGRAYAFPCDAEGRVDLDNLSERSRNNYLFARAVVGRDFDTPAIVACIH